MKPQHKILLWTYIPCLVYTYIMFEKSLNEVGRYQLYKPHIVNFYWAIPIIIVLIIGLTKFHKVEFKVRLMHAKNFAGFTTYWGWKREFYESQNTGWWVIFGFAVLLFGITPWFFNAYLTGILCSSLFFVLVWKAKQQVILYQKRVEYEEELKLKDMQEKEQDYGVSDWTPYPEFKALNQEPGKNGLYIGYDILRTHHAHFVTCAPPRQGKGTTLIIPNLIKQPCGSYVITDPKGEIACITARAQKEYGQKVYILDPWELQEDVGATHGIPISGFNPFDMLRMDMKKLPDRCEMIAGFLIVRNDNVKDPYWQDRGRTFIKNLLIHIITYLPIEEQNFLTLYQMLRTDTDDLSKLLTDMGKNNAYDGIVATFAKEYLGLMKSPNTFGGVISEAQNGTKIFESPQLRKSLSSSEFNPYDLANGDCTVYINIHSDYIESHAAWFKMIIALCLKAVNAKPNKQVNFMIDEAGYLGKMKELMHDGYTFGAGQGIHIWTFFQSVAMIKDIYGEDGMNDLIGKANIFQVFKLRDKFSCEYVSQMLGNKTRVKSREPSSKDGEHTSESYDYRLLPPEEVASEPNMIIFADGKKARLERIPYFSDDFPAELREKADPPPRRNATA